MSYRHCEGKARSNPKKYGTNHDDFYEKPIPSYHFGRKSGWEAVAQMYVCHAGHMAVRKTKESRKKEKKMPREIYHFDVNKCKVCSLREGCYKPDAKHKTYKVTIKPDMHSVQLAFQETDHFKQKYKERYKIEVKNAELKHVYGYDRAISYGLHAMQMQAAVAIFAANLKRILKLI